MITSSLRAIRDMLRLTRGLPNLRILLISGLIGTVGGGLLHPVLPLYLEQQGLNLARIGVVFTLGSLLPIVLQPVLGALSDRFSRKWFVVGISLFTSSLLPLFTVLNETLWLAAVLALKLTLERSAAPVASAMVGDFAPRAQRAMVFATLDACTNLVFVAALLLSPFVLSRFALDRVFFAAAGLFMLSSLVLLRLRETRDGAGPLPSHAPAKNDLNYVRTSSALTALFCYQLAFSFALDLFPLYLPLYAVRLGAGQGLVGPIIASSWLMYALVQPMGGRLANQVPDRRRLIVGGLLGMAVCAVAIGAAEALPGGLALPFMVGMWVLIAIPDGLFRPAAQALVLDIAPDRERGRLLGALSSSASLAHVAAPLAYGMVAQRFGLGAAFALSGAALGIAAVSMARVRRSAFPASPNYTPISA